MKYTRFIYALTTYQFNKKEPIMNNVIYVDFVKKTDATCMDVDLVAYLNSLRDLGVDEDDILDTLDAINDIDCYVASDNEVKEFADGWFNQFA